MTAGDDFLTEWTRINRYVFSEEWKNKGKTTISAWKFSLKTGPPEVLKLKRLDSSFDDFKDEVKNAVSHFHIKLEISPRGGDFLLNIVAFAHFLKKLLSVLNEKQLYWNKNRSQKEPSHWVWIWSTFSPGKQRDDKVRSLSALWILDFNTLLSLF